MLSIDSSGGLTSITGSPFALSGSGYPGPVHFNSTGSTLYLSAWNSGTGSLMHAMSVSATTGVPTDITGSPFTICYSIIAFDIAHAAQP